MSLDGRRATCHAAQDGRGMTKSRLPVEIFPDFAATRQALEWQVK